MTLSRRRFITIAALGALAPAAAHALGAGGAVAQGEAGQGAVPVTDWRGIALGAEARIVIIEGLVTVDGEVDTRRGRGLADGAARRSRAGPAGRVLHPRISRSTAPPTRRSLRPSLWRNCAPPRGRYGSGEDR